MRRLALAAVGLLAAASAFAFVPKVAHATNYCTFTEFSVEHQHAVTLNDGNYINVFNQAWQVQPSNCTEWAGHHYGATQVDTLLQLGTTADEFPSPQAQLVFGYAWPSTLYTNCLFKPAFPAHYSCDNNDNPFWNHCATYNNWNCTSITNPPSYQATNAVISGTGNTTLEVASSVDDAHDFWCEGGLFGATDRVISESTGNSLDQNGIALFSQVLTSAPGIGNQWYVIPHFDMTPNPSWGQCS